MEQLPTLGRDIAATIEPTFQIFGDILRREENSKAIHAVSYETHAYGPNPRNILDIYKASSKGLKNSSSRALLLFIYGGGFVSGDRNLSEIEGGVVYKNVGYFMAERLGFDTAIMDYSLIKHGANFSTGLEEVELAIKWLRKFYTKKDGTSRDLHILGNSAGGIQLISWLLQTALPQMGDQGPETTKRVRLRSVVILGSPFLWDSSSDMQEILLQYYGSEEMILEMSPLRVLERWSGTEFTKSKWPHLLVIVSEYDPVYIVETSHHFMQRWKEMGGEGDFWELKGHNHISPPLALGTGIVDAEAWGFELGGFLDTLA